MALAPLLLVAASLAAACIARSSPEHVVPPPGAAKSESTASGGAALTPSRSDESADKPETSTSKTSRTAARKGAPKDAAAEEGEGGSKAEASESGSAESAASGSGESGEGASTAANGTAADTDEAEADDGEAGDGAATAKKGKRTALAHVTVSEPAGISRAREPLTFGVPFARGALKDAAMLRCWHDDEGTRLPIQARALSKWPDGTVRWALVDTQVPLEAHAEVRLAIGTASDIKATPLKWGALPDPSASKDNKAAASIPMIEDGTTSWRMLTVAALNAPAKKGEKDAPPPPAASAGDAVLGLSSVLTDAFDRTYVSSLDLASLEMLEVGPLRLCFRIAGSQRAVDAKSELPTFHTFSVVVSVLSGCSRARVEWTLQNGALKDPTGPLAFNSYELLADTGDVMALAAEGDAAEEAPGKDASAETADDGSASETADGSEEASDVAESSSSESDAAEAAPEEEPAPAKKGKAGSSTRNGKSAKGKTADAKGAGDAKDAKDAKGGRNGKSTKESDKAPAKPQPKPFLDVPGTTTPGDEEFALRQDGPVSGMFDYEIGGERVDSPDGDLWAGVRCGKAGVWVLRRESANNHPAAISHEPGGPLRVGLLPAGGGATFWLDDATQKTFRLEVVRDVGKAGAALLAQCAAPAHVTLDPAEVAASGAWGDAGVFYVPDAAEMQQPVEFLPRDPTTGWVDWGEFSAKNTHETGSPRNRLSVYLEAVQSGRADLYALAEARAHHAMDLRPYHVVGFKADKNPKANLHEGTPHPNEPAANRLGRSEMDGRFKKWKQDLPPKGHGYNGFDPEHMTLDDVYECWLLTGDWVAHSALVSAGEAMLTWRTVMPGGKLHTARTTGWTLRALVQVYRATGDQRYIDAAADMVARADKERGRGLVKYLHRNKKDARHIENKESESPFMVAVAMHGLAAYYTETEDKKVPPMLRDLTAFEMASFRGNGFVDDQPCDGPITGGKVSAPLGVSQWIPGAIAEAAFITGNHAPVDAIFPYYREMTQHEGHELRFGSPSWHWWQCYLASLEKNHGKSAVREPAGFKLPAPEASR